VTFDQRRLRLAVTVAIAGVLLPFLAWGWAKAIDERLVFEEFPDPILLAFNGVAFAALAFASVYLRRAIAVGGLLALVGISIQLHMGCFLLSECTQDRCCPTVWRYRLP
jgi:hypothetical protein